MIFKYLWVVGMVLLGAVKVSVGFDILTPIAFGVGSVVYGTICSFRECCAPSAIPANFKELEKQLNERVYGQHLAVDLVTNAIRSHWNEKHTPQKALTLSFHGWPGSGKNYVSQFIVDNLYTYGSKSKFVHHFIGRLHFPLKSRVTDYQLQLNDWLKSNVSACPQQLFIFDEVDKMPSQVLNAIKPMIDYRDDVDGVDYRKSIFIFLSNTGAELINEHLLDLWRDQGVKREDLRMKDFEKLISLGAFNEEGGFHFSDAIRSNLIDHYIPFLPMEERHVKQCVLDEFKRRNINNPAADKIQEVMEFVEWGPNKEKLFSKTGCKRISQKVGITAVKYRMGPTS